jgi:hypothetical protein
MHPPRWLGVGLLLALLVTVVFLCHAGASPSGRSASGRGPGRWRSTHGQGIVLVNAGGPVRIPDAWGQVLDWLRCWLPFVPPWATETRTVPGSVSIVDASG